MVNGELVLKLDTATTGETVQLLHARCLIGNFSSISIVTQGCERFSGTQQQINGELSVLLRGAGSSCHSSSSVKYIAIGVGVGGAILVAGIAFGLWLFLRQRRRKQSVKRMELQAHEETRRFQ